MCNTTLRQYLDGQSIWGAIKLAHNFPFINNDEDVATLDLMQSLNFGQKIVFSAFTGVNINSVAGQIVKLYSDKWNKLIEANNLAANIGANNTHKITENINFTGDKNGTGETDNKVSAYNSDDLITDTGASNNTTEKNITETVRSVTDETFNLQTAFNNLSLVEKNNIIGTVLKDVSNYLTVSVY